MWVGKCPEQFAINFPPRVLWVSASHPCWAANYSNLVPTTSTASTASTRLHNLKLQDSSVLAHGDSIGVNPRLMGSKDKYEIQSRRKKTCQILQGYMPGYAGIATFPFTARRESWEYLSPPSLEIFGFSSLLKLLESDQKPRMWFFIFFSLYYKSYLLRIATKFDFFLFVIFFLWCRAVL